MSIIDELNSIEDFIKRQYPTHLLYKQNTPLDPKPNSFVVKVLHTERKREVAGHNLIERDFEIVYFGSDVVDVLSVIDELSTLFYEKYLYIPFVNQADRYIAIDGFGYSEPVKSENGIDFSIGILKTCVREGLPTSNDPLIGDVKFKLN